MEGSIQAITSAINDKFLIIGVNNTLCAYSLTTKKNDRPRVGFNAVSSSSQVFNLELLDQKTSGTFI
jgi:hypothetical protein